MKASSPLPASLIADWRRGCAAAALLPVVVAAAARLGGVSLSWRWLIAAWLGIAYVAWRVWRWLPANRPPEPGGEVYPRLGWGNALSCFRGALLALVAAAGLTGEGLTRPGLAVTASLYALAASLDLADGYLARRTGRVTLLGQWLDLHLDGWGVFWASWAAVRSGQMPFWFLAVGLARPGYVLYETWLRHRRRGPGPWPPSPWRRPLAGAMMVVLAVVLLPWLHPPLTTWLGAAVTGPFLLHFAFDAWAVRGRASAPEPSESASASGPRGVYF